MSARELERFARDMHRDESIYRAALAAGATCRSVFELEVFFLSLGYEIHAADLRDAQGLGLGFMPPPAPVPPRGGIGLEAAGA